MGPMYYLGRGVADEVALLLLFVFVFCALLHHLGGLV